MEILFANKHLLSSAYRQLFIERLTHLDKLKESIKCRYDKKELSSFMAVGLVTVASAYITNFIINKLKTNEVPPINDSRFTHQSLYTDLYGPTNENFDRNQEISPFHNNQWMLVKYKDENQQDKFKLSTDAVNCVRR